MFQGSSLAINCQHYKLPGYIFVGDSISSLNLTQLAPQVAGLCEIGLTRNDDHWAVQGHSRSPILVPIENPCAISYQWINELVSYFALFPGIVAYWSNIISFDRVACMWLPRSRTSELWIAKFSFRTTKNTALCVSKYWTVIFRLGLKV